MTSLIHSIRRRTVVAGLVVASFAGAGGALASLDSGSDYADPEVLQLGYGPGGPPPVSIRTVANPEPSSVPCEAPHTPSQWVCE
jgi:hypothetical protein